jgi:ferredoxin
MKVVLEKEKCIGCGTCVALCPKYFQMQQDDRANLKGGVSSGETEQLTISNIECIKDAADSCPGQAINIE